MKSLLLAMIVSATALAAQAQNAQSEFEVVTRDVVCAPLEKILEVLLNTQVAEKPIWRGKEEGNKSDFVVLVNEKTKTWTVVQYQKDYGCVLGIGEKSEFFQNQSR